MVSGWTEVPKSGARRRRRSERSSGQEEEEKRTKRRGRETNEFGKLEFESEEGGGGRDLEGVIAL
jgi:hypothetical protein